MNWLAIAKQYEQEYIEKTQALLRIPTVLEKYEPNNLEAPFGRSIRKALDHMLTTAEIEGFKTKNIFNYAGHIEMGEGKEILAVLGHLDVVPTGGKWDFDPFGATLKDGKIFARGAMDDKGPTIAAYIAFRMVQDQKIKLNKRVRLILGCDEESGMRCIKTYLEHEEMPDLGFAPDAEFPLIYAEKGNFSFDIVGNENDPLVKSMQAGERYNVVPDECVAVLKKDVKKAWLDEEMARRAAAQANEMANSIRQGKSATSYASMAGVNVRLSQPISLLGDMDKDLIPTAIQHVFLMKKGDVITLSGPGRQYIIRLADIVPVDPNKPEPSRLKVVDDLKHVMPLEILNHYSRYVKKIFPVHIDSELLKELRNRSSTDVD